MTREELSKLSNKELAEAHNRLAIVEGGKVVSVPWKGKKEVIVDRILALMPEPAAAVAVVPEPEATPSETDPPAKKEAKGGRQKGSKAGGDTVRALSEKLLLEVTGTDDDKRPLGHSYEDIRKKVIEKFPQANTSLNALRWYATHLNNQHKTGKPRVMLPARPKAKKEDA